MIKIAICDDNKEFSQSLKEKVEKFFTFNKYKTQIEVFNTTDEINNISFNNYDIYLLDIEMNGVNGINLGQDIRKMNNTSSIIYVSSFVSYAHLGYSTKATSYLIKTDVNFDNLLSEGLNRILLENHKNNYTTNIKSNREDKIVLLNDIIYIESIKRQIVYHLNNKENILEYMKLSEKENELSDKGFIRIQQGYLVNMEYIETISSYKVYLKNGEVLNAKKDSYSEIVKKFTLWKGKI